MRRRRENTKGFTLVELVAVIAIAAILTAIAIPTFSGLNDNAKIAVDLENIRSAKTAAVTEHLRKHAGEEKVYYFDAESGTVTDDKTRAASFPGYGKSSGKVEGADGLPVKEGKAQILTVAVKADGTCTETWGLGSELDSFLGKAIQLNKEQKLRDDALINAMGALPSVAASDLFGTQKLQNDVATLYWRPRAVTIDGKSAVILYANQGSTGHAAWQAFAFYYNGNTYRSTNHGGYQGRINRNAIGSIKGNFDDYIADPANHWEKVG